MFFINPTIKSIIIIFRFCIQFITFYFNYFFYPKFCLIYLLQLFFVKLSKNLFTVLITNNICQRNSVFNFSNNKNLIWAIWFVTFCINIFIFQYSYMVTLNVVSFLLFITPKSIYVLGITPNSFIIIVLWYVLSYLLTIAANLSKILFSILKQRF